MKLNRLIRVRQVYVTAVHPLREELSNAASDSTGSSQKRRGVVELSPE